MPENQVCESCNKSTQKEYPGGSPCDDIYQLVDQCMKAHKGQISPCASQWKAFQDCRLQNR